jgi:hypothetical protein
VVTLRVSPPKDGQAQCKDLFIITFAHLCSLFILKFFMFSAQRFYPLGSRALFLE